jgi:hypothetical protein
MTVTASRRKPAGKAIRAVPKDVHDTVTALLQLEAQPAPVLRKALLLSEKQSGPGSLVRLAKAIGSHVLKQGQHSKPAGAWETGPRPPNDLRIVHGSRDPRAAVEIDALTGRRALAAANAVQSVSPNARRVCVRAPPPSTAFSTSRGTSTRARRSCCSTAPPPSCRSSRSPRSGDIRGESAALAALGVDFI